MYVSKTLHQKNAVFIDLDDIEFFHQTIQAAISEYESYGDIDNADDEIDVKRKETPVIYYSTVSGKKSIDDIITRKEMNTRGRRRFIMIDVDLEEDEWVKYDEIREDLIRLAETHNTYLLIYPTVSFPTKPRFRAVMFNERLMGKGSHYQAISWLYDNLGIPVSDKSDLYMSNNNAPKFTNSQQIKSIYSNLHKYNPEGKNKKEKNPELQLLDNKLWGKYYKPKFEKVDFDSDGSLEKSEKDTFEFTDDLLDTIAEIVIETESYMEYDEFWKLVHSLIRAEYFKQITEQQIIAFLEKISRVAKDVITQEDWKRGNVEFYRSEKDRLSETDLAKSKPLINHKIFRELYISNNVN